MIAAPQPAMVPYQTASLYVGDLHVDATEVSVDTFELMLHHSSNRSFLHQLSVFFSTATPCRTLSSKSSPS